MGNCCSQGKGGEVEFPDVPESVKHVFKEFADENGVITSKALLKFFQEYQQDKGVLHGPIANLLLSFPSTGGNDEVAAAPAPKERMYRSMTFKGQGSKLSQAMGKVSHTVGSKAKVVAGGPNEDRFFHLLMNPTATAPIIARVSHDMKQPMSHYFIFTGHNSYLSGNQLTSDSSVKPIIKALQRGVRVIELDLWPNNEKTDIVVMHGGTLTKPVGFDDCIKAIKEHAFVASEYPVIITLEDHLTAPLQAKAAQSLTAILGDTLYCPKDGDDAKEFPSPFSLRGKILISTQPPKGPKELSTVVATEDPAEEKLDARPAEGEAVAGAGAGGDGVTAVGSEERRAKAKVLGLGEVEKVRAKVEKEREAANAAVKEGRLHEVNESELLEEAGAWEQEDAAAVEPEQLAPEYRRLIAIPGGKLTGGQTVEDGLRDTGEGPPKRVSFSESQLLNTAKTCPKGLVSFTQRNLLRIYPFGLRVTSSNYEPMPAWLHGAQMVAMNMQGYGRPLWIVHGFFSANGGCGFVKKPDFYLKPGNRLEGIQEGDESAAGSTEGAFDPSVPRPIQMFLRVRVVVGTGWLERFGKGHFDTYSKPDFYCKVSIEGAPSDATEKKLDVCNDTWCPSWDSVTLEFPLILPELALLCIEVLEKDQFQDDFGGQAVLPVASLKPGFRCVSLYDRKGHPLVEVGGEEVVGPRLLCHFEMGSPFEDKDKEEEQVEELPHVAQKSAGGSYEV
ncbi:hypothetical protein CLOM_g8191 [Closterium sp. NIES-68]|nr:hypothetical protein CLOM_g8191 [Closterium sp. NIES-68]